MFLYLLMAVLTNLNQNIQIQSCFMQNGGIITDVQADQKPGKGTKNTGEKLKAQSQKLLEKVVVATKQSSKGKEEDSVKVEESNTEEKKTARKRGRRKAR